MLIHRSVWPSRTSSTISTLGASGSCGRAPTAPRDRAVRRRRGLGRFGTGTSRLVAQHEVHSTLDSTWASDISVQTGFRSVGRGWYGCASHSWTHPEGWRDWPYETPATARHGKHCVRERCQFLTDVAGGFQTNPPPTNRRMFFSWELPI